MFISKDQRMVHSVAPEVIECIMHEYQYLDTPSGCQISAQKVVFHQPGEFR